MHSYVREISCGLANHNIITLIMLEYGLGLQEALDSLATRTDEVIERFLANAKKLPSWGEEIDSKVQIYVNSLGQWVRGSDDWSCEAMRYHGTEGLRIRDTRLITICPRKANYVKEDEVPKEVAAEVIQVKEIEAKEDSTAWEGGGEAKQGGSNVMHQSCSTWTSPTMSEKTQSQWTPEASKTSTSTTHVTWITNRMKFWWKSLSVSLRDFFSGTRRLRT